MPTRYFTVRDSEKAAAVGTRIRLAGTCLSRLCGLLGQSGLDWESGLWIRPSSGVHTFAMRFPIDVLDLDRSLRVLRVWPSVKPNHVTGLSWRTCSVLELPAGKAAALGIEAGDHLEITATISPDSPT